MTTSQGHPYAAVDHDLCAGVAQCVVSAPGAFELDTDGLSVFRPDGAWTVDQLRDAADMCPMAAISLSVGPGR